MKTIHSVNYKNETREELLPGFDPDFPYIASYIELDKFPGRRAPWHWHKEVEIFYMEKGDLEYHTPGGITVFPVGSGGFINSNVLHMTKPLEGMKNTVQKLHLFAPSFIGGLPGSLLEQKYVAPLISSQIEIAGLYPRTPEQDSLLRLLKDSFLLTPDSEDYEIKLRSLLSDFWCGLLHLTSPQWSEKKNSIPSNHKIKLMMGYIQEHYDEKLTMAEIAAAAYISERECFRSFRQKLNMTPAEYIKSCRLQKACAMLTGGEESLAAIGQTCGLGSSSYFSKVFRESMGCTPREYRLKWQDFDRNGRK
ncbi:AraC family transcriptional regulator [Clostridium sp. Marseille-P2415]|uniref:AraC family transcriptional regulator n=1 Tax=Clostridium sp. Marseille-P2415 TaxID=1805471 RepID=UPI00098845D8|nr:AraC family transcriptional regulator [Clostridium sp. Marseille-P2415]